MRLATGLSLPVSVPLLSDSGFQLGHIFLTYSKSHGWKGFAAQPWAPARAQLKQLEQCHHCVLCLPGLTRLLALQDCVVRAPGTGMAVQDPACRGSHLADRQRRGSQTSPCHCQPGQRGQCEYLSCRSPSDSCLSGREGWFKGVIILVTRKRKGRKEKRREWETRLSLCL